LIPPDCQQAGYRLGDEHETVLGALDVLALEAPADAIYGVARVARADGTSHGTKRSANRRPGTTLGLTIATNKEREFSQVGGPPIENSLR
jgi:hypothetical protein